MAFDPISAVLNLVNTGLDKFLSDKMPEAEKEALKQQMQFFALSEARKSDGAFRQFVLEYEGAAKDVPQFVVVIRALIRPLFTFLLAYLDWLFFTGNTSTWHPEAISLLKAVNIIVLGFWFGERALQRSGIIDVLKTRAERDCK
jgi:hypothetical protein